VGDIRQRLGQIDQAEDEYRRALEKLRALDVSPPVQVGVCVERARCYNEIGSVRSARFEPEAACEAHQQALAALESFGRAGLFPWQGHSASTTKAEEGLRKALDESEWLVAHNPTIPHYARSKGLILAKLGTICWETDRVAEAASLFEQALETQSALIDGFANLPAHDRVLREFFRLRLAAVYGRRSVGSANAARKSREMLATCAENLAELTGRPELADDRLASSALRIARQALARSKEKTTPEREEIRP
jgi:tetratricopeptide (TPR) repeat protein